MKCKIAVDAGHGLHTKGKRCLKKLDPNQTREWTLNSRIASQVITHLERCGAECLRLDDASGKQDIPLSGRVATANAAKADYCVSIHHNAGINGGTGGGAVVYVYSGRHSDRADKLRESVYGGLIDAVGSFGNRSKPLASANLYLLGKTDMPAVLVEVGFMDSATDVPLILDEAWAEKAAEGIARGIARAAGIGWVEPFAPCLVRVTAGELNIRPDAAASGPVRGKLVRGEVVRVNEARRNGSTRWGRLNLGLGWISLGYTERI